MDWIVALVGPSKDYDGWFGLLGITLVFGTAVGAAAFSYMQLLRAGRQRVAEARLAWSEEYQGLVIKLYAVLAELARLQDKPGTIMEVRRRTKRVQAQQLAIKMLVMVNPESDDAAASAEYSMEVDLGRRLAAVGVFLDLGFVRTHRRVLKHAWHRAKKEF